MRSICYTGSHCMHVFVWQVEVPHAAESTGGSRARGALVGFMATVLAVSLMVPGIALADPSAAEKQAEAQAALASLNSMQEKLSKAADAYDDALAAQKDAEAKRDDAQARIDEASAQIADLQDRLGSRARSMYRSGGSSALDLLLGATSFRSFATNWDLLNSINESDAELVQQTKDLRAEVQEQEAVLAEQERIAAQKASEALRTKDETASTMAAMQSTYDSLSAEAAALVEQERAAQVAAYEAQAQATVDASADQAQQGSITATAATTAANPLAEAASTRLLPTDRPIAGRWWAARTASLASRTATRSQLRRRSVVVRLLGLRVVLPERLRPHGKHAHVHELAPGKRSSAGRRGRERRALRHLHRRRPDDPRGYVRRGRGAGSRAARHDHRATLVNDRSLSTRRGVRRR